jgi:hypothetical protein
MLRTSPTICGLSLELSMQTGNKLECKCVNSVKVCVFDGSVMSCQANHVEKDFVTSSAFMCVRMCVCVF